MEAVKFNAWEAHTHGCQGERSPHFARVVVNNWSKWVCVRWLMTAWMVCLWHSRWEARGWHEACAVFRKMTTEEKRKKIKMPIWKWVKWENRQIRHRVTDHWSELNDAFLRNVWCERKVPFIWSNVFLMIGLKLWFECHQMFSFFVLSDFHSFIVATFATLCIHPDTGSQGQEFFPLFHPNQDNTPKKSSSSSTTFLVQYQ